MLYSDRYVTVKSETATLKCIFLRSNFRGESKRCRLCVVFFF